MGLTWQDYPDVWGAGQLLAFSGVEGVTDWFAPFVLHTGEAPWSFEVKLPVAASVRLEGAKGPFSAILGDCLVGQGGRAAFTDCHTLIGEVAPGVRLTVNDHMATDLIAKVDAGMGLELLSIQQGRRWALLVRRPGDHIDPRGLWPADWEALLKARRAFVERVAMPAGLAPGERRLLRKAVSVMKVNIEAASGCIGRRWSTPDRWPHRHMWLWDSAFHGVGMAHVEVALAQEIVLAMLEQGREDGMLPHMVPAGAPPSVITQPPILGWAVQTIFARGGDRDWADACRPHLRRYLDWMRTHRDQNGNGIPEWAIEGEPLCRCGESGLDNSPVYDRAVLLDAPDFGAFLANDYACLAALGRILGDEADAVACEREAARIGDAVNRHLWRGERGLYYHLDFAGNFVDTDAVSGFMPLFSGLPDAARAAALRATLLDPSRFAAPMPVPSIALNSGVYCKDMWRGPSWMNLSYLIVLGLRRHGFGEDAARLQTRLLGGIRDWYERDGCIWEYYDSLALTSPRGLDRKQRLISGQGIGPISDYHWTAAVSAAMLLETSERE